MTHRKRRTAPVVRSPRWNTPWTEEETQLLQMAFAEGWDDAEIGELTERTTGGVEQRRLALGLYDRDRPCRADHVAKKSRESHPEGGRPWTPAECDLLESLVRNGGEDMHIARKLRRSYNSIVAKRNQLGLARRVSVSPEPIAPPTADQPGDRAGDPPGTCCPQDGTAPHKEPFRPDVLWRFCAGENTIAYSLVHYKRAGTTFIRIPLPQLHALEFSCERARELQDVLSAAIKDLEEMLEAERRLHSRLEFE